MNKPSSSHMSGASTMDMSAAPPMPATTNNHGNPMMHMTFFWGKNAEILFSGWPGYNNNIGMYILALFVIFTIGFAIEWLSHTDYISRSENNVTAGLIQTVLYGVRIGCAYLVMLAVMSFNGGIFVAAIVGHTLGFLVFGSKVFKKSTPLMAYAKASELPACNC
ncbi:Copper transporter 6 [Capsicum annuum]|uniref:Copper transport protein n=1 Tax=Capsicum annuum TaxID=4072 RepID=A0A1U8EPV6_CAPAN|nr:copper transporter 6 [Capsicum annuum]PHT95814.1 Copper transporter 6 [Capsicum annuum]